MAGRIFSQNIRNFSINCTKLTINKNAVGGLSLVEKVAVRNDGKVIVAWHPDVQIPYEYTKPIPQAEKLDSASLIKEVSLQTAMSAFRNKHPEVARQELMQLTHTTKHRWFPRSRDKKAKKTPMDRPYL
ncbi:39S ribosomal protein L42, mitochondrial-like [Teleopsis dalmanni]|uniref:39S ribosomal protein L42, mitochondrial-like n=1 Tax=Teleopsis dalmanni TaxID=139649 RepID=UPI0018CD44EE|nr:39S ribosomal protein L42, mitochondrial-like [Teleopsis dalmanni]